LKAIPTSIKFVTLDTKSLGRNFASAWRRLHSLRPDSAIDMQGLIQSALVARIAGPRILWGFDRHSAREPLACLLYSHRVSVRGPHCVQRNLQLAAAAGATTITDQAWIPPGNAEGELPEEPFVLASPFVGWAGKQWPVEYYVELAELLLKEGLPLVLNVSAQQMSALPRLSSVLSHVSSISGLIAATRRAAAVLGVDSGPLHLAAALQKPGVAIYGPTNPLATGPYGGSLTVLRADDVATTYARHQAIHPSMRAITPQLVAAALLKCLARQAVQP
jgi:heptosyltransferase-1